MTVVLRVPNRAICAPPRKAASSSRAGRAPNTPASYTSWRSGATVRCARLHTMFGNPTPTKQTLSPASVRELAEIIISFFEYPFMFIAGATLARSRSLPPSAPHLRSRVLPVVDLPRPALSRLQVFEPVPELLQVIGVALQVVDPLPQPGLEHGRVLRDLLPLQVEAVVAKDPAMLEAWLREWVY